MKSLRPLRIIVSTAVTFSLVLIFVDFYRIIPSWFIEAVVFFQFIPSILSFISSVSIAAAGFIIIILFTIISGRVYCSFICPLGFCQDLFIRMGIKLRKNGTKSYSKPHYFFFYSILALSAVSFIFSGTTFILWLDPFSIFGRFMTYSASFPLLGMNNGLASFLIKKNIFSINSFNIRPSTAGLIFSLSSFSIIMLLSFLKGRLYCNSICPAGAILSLISRISLFRLRLNGAECLKCGICERVCKSSCINFRNNYIDTSRCVLCFDCVSQCPNGSISLKRLSGPAAIYNDIKKNTADSGNGTITRLSFLSGMTLIPKMLLSADKDRNILYYQDPEKQKLYMRENFSSPPGSISIKRFNRSCTACSLCVSACPTSVLQPAVLQYGLSGIMQPFMDFGAGFCNYDCTICGDICPAGAIEKRVIENKRQIQTGKSVFVKENCITYTNGTDCGACSEHCPTKAVHMIPFKNNLVIPEVNTDICTGCGACEYACPVRPLRAIYVNGNTIHKTAKLPLEQKSKTIKSSEFPF